MVKASRAAAVLVSIGMAVAPTSGASARTGSYDRTFATAGAFVSSLGAQTALGARTQGIVRQADGKLLTGGELDGKPAAVRLNADGSLDSSFGTGGKATIAVPSAFYGSSVALAPGGRFLVGGSMSNALTIAAFTSTGAPDTSFGTGGIARVTTAGMFAAGDIAVQPDGAIVVAGADTGSPMHGRVTRITSAGALDTTFGSGGTTTVGGTDSFLSSVMLDGTNIVTAGFESLNATAGPDGIIARLTSAGALDASFGGTGVVTSGIPTSDFFGELALAPSGAYVVTGSGTTASRVVRYLPNGTLDPSFGTGGRVELPRQGLMETAVVVQPDGAIVVGGQDYATSTGLEQAFVLRLLPGGALDPSFGCGGMSMFDFGQAQSWISDLVLEPSGAVDMSAVTNSGFEAEDPQWVVSRLSPSTTEPSGYWMVTAEGNVEAFGVGGACGGAIQLDLRSPIAGMAGTAGGGGYWLVAWDGGIFSYGDARFFGSMGGRPLNQPIVGMAATPSGNGYWMVASDGGIFAFGDAAFYGSMGGRPLNRPIVGMASTPTGHGYWLVASDGGIFAFGDAAFSGSMGGRPLNQQVVGMAAAPSGYWLVAADGGIFAFGGAPFLGSTGGMQLNRPIIGMNATKDGYWLVASDGGVFAYNVPFYGSMASRAPRFGFIATAAAFAAS